MRTQPPLVERLAGDAIRPGGSVRGAFGPFQCAIDLDAKVSDGAFTLPAPKQELQGAAGPSCGAANGCRTPGGAANQADPSFHDPGVLSGREMERVMLPAREGYVRLTGPALVIDAAGAARESFPILK